MKNWATQLGSTLTVQGILRDKPLTIRQICNNSVSDGEQVTLNIMNTIITMSSLIAEYKRPTHEMVLAASNLILGKYSHLSQDDVTLCMSNLFTGLYGEIIAIDIERFGSALHKYSEDKRLTAITHNEKPKERPISQNESYKMPENVRQGLVSLFQKHGIANVFEKKEEKKKAERINWKEKIPSLTDQEVQIYEWFDDEWNEQGNPLKDGCVDPVIMCQDGIKRTRGEFVMMANKLI